MANDLIKKHEGFRELAYKCPAGIWTIGYGSTRHPDGTPVKQGDKITEKQADLYLQDYINKNIIKVYAHIPYSLTQWQKEALNSLIYNVGYDAFIKSKLYQAICNKNWQEVFKQWDFGVKQFKGLIKRRAEELYYFTKEI